MKISVVIPIYNERNTVLRLLETVRSQKLDQEIIMVDDGSTDGTRDILKGLKYPEVKVVFHERNQGNGAALRTGFQHAAGDIVIVQDADLEYDPGEYPRLIKPIVDNLADVVFGARFMGGPHRVLYFWHYFGNKLLTLITNVLYNVNLNDMETCYKVFRREALQGVTIRSNRFGFEPEFTAKVAKRKLRIYEVPISYFGRTYEEGKKVTWKDGFSALAALLKFRFTD
ncbi:MAG: glycosyltransferase family 2 protein [Candidatus Aureabacteria bacterium]|nr:glycosyltransferase family 2 protein [Candidatus Auribacterota bacterium]